MDRDLLARLSNAMRAIGPDDESFAYADHVGMLYRAFHATADSQYATQPLETTDGLLVAVDGRIDNVPELQRQFDVARVRPSTAEVVVAAYRVGGTDAFGEFVGDFAFALWDPRASLLVLCSDPLGRRPLYYRCTKDHVFWASSCRALVDALQLTHELNDAYIAHFLAGSVPSGSPFREVDAVGGGEMLLATPLDCVRRRYWSLDPKRELRYRTDAEYEEHFATLFSRVVADRLDSDGSIMAELSGGVDSASIACVANRTLNDRNAGHLLHTISYVFGESSTSDETSYIEVVEEALGRRGIHLAEQDCPFYRPLPPTLAPDLPTNKLAFLGRYDRVGREMAARGARVLLSGEGGDQLFLSTSLDGIAVADLVAQRRPFSAARACAVWSRELKEPLVSLLWRGVCLPMLPRALEARLQREAPVGDWLAADFVRRERFGERLLPMADDLGFDRPSAVRHYGLIRRSMRLSALEPCTSGEYIDIRYPYLDRRLIEFSLSLPLDQKLRPHETRSIVRRGLAGVVPPTVLHRRSKRGPSEALYRALDREWLFVSRLFENARTAAYGFVDPDGIRTALRRARHGMTENHALLLSTIALELWLRQLEIRPSTRDTAPPGRRQPPDSGESYAHDVRTSRAVRAGERRVADARMHEL